MRQIAGDAILVMKLQRFATDPFFSSIGSMVVKDFRSIRPSIIFQAFPEHFPRHFPAINLLARQEQLLLDQKDALLSAQTQLRRQMGTLLEAGNGGIRCV